MEAEGQEGKEGAAEAATTAEEAEVGEAAVGTRGSTEEAGAGEGSRRMGAFLLILTNTTSRLRFYTQTPPARGPFSRLGRRPRKLHTRAERLVPAILPRYA